MGIVKAENGGAIDQQAPVRQPGGKAFNHGDGGVGVGQFARDAFRIGQGGGERFSFGARLAIVNDDVPASCCKAAGHDRPDSFGAAGDE